MTDKAIEHLQQELKEKDKTISCIIESLQAKTKECEELKKLLMQKDEINTFFNTPIEGWSSNPCDICESKNNYEQLTQECDTLKSQLDFEVQRKECIEQECEELKEEYTELKLENKELYRILADLKEVRKLKDHYRKALEEIEEIVKINCEEICGRKFEDCNDFLCPSKNIIDIINKAKEQL